MVPWYRREEWIRVYTAKPEEIDPDEYVIAEYYVEPAPGLTLLDAGINIAAEESIGTWTEVKTFKSRLTRLAGRVIEVRETGEGAGIVRIAFPLELFDIESGIPNLLSIVAGNLFGLSMLRNVRLLDLHLPKEYVRAFKGPKFGIPGVRALVGTAENPRPHLGTIIKPKVGLSPEETAGVAYEAAVGGVDFIKDDETLVDQRFCRLEERVTKVMEALDRAKEETGRTVLYAVNVTAGFPRILELADVALEHGANCIMVDVITAGFAALQRLAEDPSIKIPIHVHRTMHAAFTRNRRHGISMLVVAKLVRLAGGDQLHTGTAAGKMERDLEELRRIADFVRGEWYGLKPIFPVASGGIHPGLVPKNLEFYGVDVVINAGGGIHGHPWGTRAGARAMRQAIDAYLKGIPLEEYAKDHPELKAALEHWGGARG